MKKMIKVDNKKKKTTQHLWGVVRCPKKALEFMSSYFGFICPRGINV